MAADARAVSSSAWPRGWGCTRRGLLREGLRPDGPCRSGRPPAPLSRPRTALPLRVLPLVRRPARLRALGLPGTATRRSTSRRATCRGWALRRPLRAVLEQHARWIADAGVGADDALVVGTRQLAGPRRPADHGRDARPRPQGHVRLEPYADDRARVLRERRPLPAARVRREAALGHAPAAARRGRPAGPVFKGFRIILPRGLDDCQGRPADRRDYTPDDVWRRQTDALRRDPARRLRPHDAARRLARLQPRAAPGFDGIGIYDNFIAARGLRGVRRRSLARGLLFSFNVNPGFDRRAARRAGRPATAARLRSADARARLSRARRAASARRGSRTSRIRARSRPRSRVQTDPALANAGAASSSSTSTRSTNGTRATPSSR